MVLSTTPVQAQADWWQLALSGAWGGADNGVITALAAHNGSLFMGTSNPTNGCEVYFRTPLSGGFTLIYKAVELGFGDPNNQAAVSMASFTGAPDRLFVGTYNPASGCEIWYTGDMGANFYQTHSDGLGNPANLTAHSMAVFKSELYVGTRNDSGLEVHRYDGSTWSLPVVTGGFGNSNNTVATTMTVHDGSLHVGTQNTVDGAQIWRSSDGLLWSPHVLGGLGGGNGIYGLASADGVLFAAVDGPNGAEVYSVGEGFAIQVNSNGFGDGGNWRPSAMAVLGDTVFVATDHLSAGTEVWRMNGYLDWTQVNSNGFGSSFNTGVYSLAVYQNHMWAGTVNWATGGEVWRMVLVFTDGFESGDTLGWTTTVP